jgi:predicted peroxiredoxin
MALLSLRGAFLGIYSARMERDPVRETTGKTDKVPLYMKLYFQEAYIEVARTIGYAGFPRDQLEERMKDLVDRFGRKKIQDVCGELITLQFGGKEKRSGPREDAEVRLKEDVRKLCWQLLGPPPEKRAEFERNKTATPPAPATIAKEPKPVKPDPTPRKARKRKTQPKAEPEPKPGTTLPDIPIMTQYREAKEKHPDMILLFRIGDFYEVFDKDAATLHTVLGLTLTTRDQSVAMAGFPHHQLETYLHKLLKAGLRIAVCDQVEDTVARTRREVKRVVVPDEDGDATRKT